MTARVRPSGTTKDTSSSTWWCDKKRAAPFGTALRLTTDCCLGREADRETHGASVLVCLRQSITARHGQLGLYTGEGAGAVHRIHVVETVHDLAPIEGGIAREARCPRRGDQLTGQHVFVENRGNTLVQQ